MLNFKRVLVCVLSLLILLGAIPSGKINSAHADSGISLYHNLEDGLTFGGHTTSGLTNRFTGESGMSISGLNNHKLGYYDAFCTDPLLVNGSSYILAGNASNAITDYWGAFGEIDRRYLAALIQFYYDHPYYYDCNPAHGKSANWVAKMGTQLAVFQYVLTDDTRWNISEVIDDGTWYDVKDYCSYAEQWAMNQEYAAPSVYIQMPSFDGQKIKLEYDVISGMYVAAVTDFNGALVNEGFDFSGVIDGVTVTQAGNTVQISVSPADAVALGLNNYDNDWCASATVAKEVQDTVNMNAVKLYASPQNHNTTQQLVIYDPEEEPSTVSATETSRIYAYIEATGYAQLSKTSADVTLTSGNPCYSLANATYGIYTSEDEANWGSTPVASFTTDETGASETVALTAGDYFVKEISAPAGYALDSRIYPLHVTHGETALLQVSDYPTSDPILIVLKKVDAAILAEGKSSGGMSLEGAEYRVDFYPGQFYSSEAAEASGTALRGWTLRTDARGYAYIDDEHLVSGDDFFYVDNQIVFPLGTIVVYEIKAPVGYKINDTKYVVNITEDGQAASYVHTYNEPIVPESAIMGGVRVKKMASDIENTTMQGSSLAGCEFTIYNSNEKPVVVSGVEAAPGEAALVIVTDENGYAATVDSVLPYGQYRIRETKAPAGYQINREWFYDFTVLEDGVVLDAGVCTDSPVRGGISVQKKDAIMGTDFPYGDASFEGIVFQIINASGYSVNVNGSLFLPGDVVMSITTDENGIATTGKDCLPAGLYTVKEASTPVQSGYALNTDYEETVQVDSEEIIVAAPCSNIGNVLGGIVLQKTDKGTGNASPEGNANLSGASYIVINGSENPVVVDGITYAVGETITIMITDENGVAQTGCCLPMGTYYVRELNSSEGYLLNSEWSGLAVIRENGRLIEMKDAESCPEEIIKGGISVHKLDADTQLNVGPGGVLLNNAEITIINRSEHEIVYDGLTIQPYVGEFDPSNRNADGIVTRIYTDEEGIASTGNYALPYGDYELYETAAPAGYSVNREWSKTVNIRENGFLYVLDGYDSLIDEIARTDIRFNKEGVRGNNHIFLPNVVFRVTNLESGESHILVTDPNGSFDSANQTHSYNTNGNDYAVNDAGEVDDSLLNYEYGVWFGNGNPADSLPGSGKVGAFVIGKYRIEELACAANEGYVLCEPFEVELYKRDNQESYFIGTITNNAPTLGTTLLGKDTQLHLASASENTVLVDTVSYSGLRTNENISDNTYEIRGILMDKETAEPLLINGKTVEATKVFRASDTAGTVDVVFEFDASELEGRTVVAYEYLYLNGVLVSQHDSIDDVSQTVIFPEIHTVATDEEGQKNICISNEMTIIDTVYYENLIPGYTYTLQGTLMDAETGAPVLDRAGNPVTKTEQFYVKDSSSGSTIIEFKFDGSNLKNGSLVAFEKLFVFENVFLTSHEDISDEDQAVTTIVPAIGTTLVAGNEQHVAAAKEQVELTDHVEYENLEPGKEYVLEAKLVFPDGTEVQIANGASITATKSFVPTETAGSVDVVFHFDASELAGETVVAFERLLCKGNLIAAHEDPTDESQAVHFPELKTMAAGKKGEKTLLSENDSEMVTIVDTVSYSNLIPGKTYKLSGSLHNKADNSIIRDPKSNEPFISELEFVAEKPNGTIEASFSIPFTSVQGQYLVAFEHLMLDGEVVASHEDIESEEQTVFAAYQSKVFKYDASTYEGIEGAVFEIRDVTQGVTAGPVVNVTSDKDGYIVFEGVPEHEYSLKEIKAPEEYQLSETVYKVRVGKDGTIEGDDRIPNVHGGTVIITKVDAVTGDPLEGCEISIYDTDHNCVFKQETDANGRIYFYTTKAGHYMYKETKTCDGYYLNEDEYIFTIERDLTVTGTVRFGNVPFGTAVIKKVDKSGAPLKGAQIAVFTSDGSKFLGQSSSADNGRVYFVSPGPGRYYFVEVNAPEGYIKNDTKHYFEISTDYTISGTMTLVNERNPSPSSSTGDNSNLGLWIAVAVSSLGGMLAILFFLLRKPKRVVGRH